MAREKQALGFGDDKKLLKLLLCGHKFYVLSPSLRVFENHLSNYPDELQVLSGLTAVSLPWAKYVLWPHLTSLSRKRTVALMPLQGARDFRNINSGKWKSQRTYGCREYNLCNSKGWTVGNRNLRLQVFGAKENEVQDWVSVLVSLFLELSILTLKQGCGTFFLPGAIYNIILKN